MTLDSKGFKKDFVQRNKISNVQTKNFIKEKEWK